MDVRIGNSGVGRRFSGLEIELCDRFLHIWNLEVSPSELIRQIKLDMTSTVDEIATWIRRLIGSCSTDDLLPQPLYFRTYIGGQLFDELELSSYWFLNYKDSTLILWLGYLAFLMQASAGHYLETRVWRLFSEDGPVDATEPLFSRYITGFTFVSCNRNFTDVTFKKKGHLFDYVIPDPDSCMVVCNVGGELLGFEGLCKESKDSLWVVTEDAYKTVNVVRIYKDFELIDKNVGISLLTPKEVLGLLEDKYDMH